MTIPEVARRLGVADVTIWKWVRRGSIESIKLGRCRRIPVEVVDRLFKQGVACLALEEKVVEQPKMDDDIRYRDLRALAIEQHREAQDELVLHRRALRTLLALITGQPIMTDALQALLKELGHVPVSPLLVPGAVVGKPS